MKFKWPVTIVKRSWGRKAKIVLEAGKIVVFAPTKQHALVALESTRKWIENKIKEYEKFKNPEKTFPSEEEFEKFCTSLVKKFSNELKVEIKGVRFKDMKTIWGSYSLKTKKISLNKKLIYLPKEVTEYVIFHEVLHAIYPDHGKEFKNVIKKRFPDWKALRKELRKFEYSTSHLP